MPAGVLDQGAGYQVELSFTPVEPGERPVSKMVDTELGQGGQRGAPICARRSGGQTQVGGASHDRDVQGGERERDAGGLRHVGDQPGELTCRQLGGVDAGHPDRAVLCGEQAEHAAQQRGLPGAVGPEQGAHVGLAHAQRDVGEPVSTTPVAEPQPGDLDPVHSHWRPARASSATKKGAPISAVRMPSGRSTEV